MIGAPMGDLNVSSTHGDESRWALTPEALDSLLDLLGPDRDEAGRRYEQIRAKLTRIFDWRGCHYPEELADETMNRVAHKLAGGLEVRADDPFRYFCGVAQMVFKEVLREQKKNREALSEMRQSEPVAFHPPDPAEEDERLRCLRDCMAQLDDDQRSLMVDYYTGEGGRRIRNRKKLARRLGIAMNALRIRAYRLRSQLEDCVRDCASTKNE
jgi:DNA-directed RNA polymerase specialized sigma24 family protein